MKRFLPICLLLLLAPITRAQSGRTFYIDFSSGSNSNVGSKASPWKSSPFMQQGAGCAGATHSYSASPGDQIIFKGGVTWPSACFQMLVTASGSSQSTVSGPNLAPTINGAIYFGVDVTWYTGGSFTRPLFDMAGSGIAGGTFAVIQSSASYITFDDIEIAHNLASGTCGGSTMDFAGSTGVTVNRMYIHDWTVSGGYLNADHFTASICGNGGTSNNTLGVYNTEMSDAAQPAGKQVGSCTVYVNDMGWDNCHNMAEGVLFMGFGTLHDTQIHDLDGNAAYVGNVAGTHANGTESSYAGAPSAFYNVYENNLDVGFNQICPGVNYYNNTISNVFNSGISGGAPQFGLQIDTNCAGTTSSTATAVYNSTFSPQGAQSGGGSVQIVTRPSGISGVVTLRNLISINSGFDLSGATSTPVQSNNYAMPTAEATTYGFTVANKFSPSSSDSHTVGQGATLPCTGVFVALCTDPSGAPWFGGSGKSRGSAFDIGSFQFSGGATGPPMVSFTSPSSGPQSGTLTLTVTATPQGAATIASCQFTIDGFTFGSAITMSPYTTTWNTVTASNARAHVVSATCTDSNSQTGTASNPPSVTPTNTHANGFVSDSLWAPGIPNQTFTPFTSGTHAPGVCIRPYTAATGDNETGVSQALPTGYGDFSAIIAIRAGGYIQAYNGTGGVGYTALPTATSYPVVANTQYCFTWTINMSTQQYSVAEISPSVATIATNFGFRAAATSLGFLSAYASNNSTPDTVEVANFGVPATPALSFNPGNLSFPPTVATMTSMLTDSVTIMNGPATIMSAVVAGTGFSLDGTGTCPTSGSLSASCTYIVDFTPSVAGSYSGTLTVTGNQSASPQVFTLTGTGVAASPTFSCAPSSLNVGSARLANPPVTIFAGPITCTITNPPTTFTTVVTSGGDAADFGVSSNGCSSTVSASTCGIIVSFSPSKIGSESTTLVISSSDATNSPQNVTLSATGQIPAPPVAPSNSMFMASVTKAFQVPLTINGISLGTVPFNAMIDFICTDCDPVKQTCGSCVAQ